MRHFDYSSNDLVQLSAMMSRVALLRNDNNKTQQRTNTFDPCKNASTTCRCNSQKYTYPRNYTPGIFLRMKISQKHTGGMFLHQAKCNR